MKKFLIFFLLPNLAMAADCLIPDYSSDYTVVVDCDDLLIAADYANTLTIDADIISGSTGTGAIHTYSYSINKIIINTGSTVQNTTGASGITLSSYDHGTIENKGSIISNSGHAIILQGTGSNAGTLVNLINSGSITAPGAVSGALVISTSKGISNFTNTGIMNGGGVDISTSVLASTYLTNFRNSQGGSDAVTYQGKLPVNYFIIINSTSDYGKIDFSEDSGISGTTNFGIDSTSTLTPNTTYSSIMKGITGSQINSGSTSGTIINEDGAYDWELINADGSTTIWNLVVSTTSTLDTQQSIQASSYAIASQFSGYAMSTNYANMNTYDCGLFDAKGGCFSIGGRYSDVNVNNNNDSSSSALVAVGGFRINDNFRVSGFIDQQANSNTPDGITLDNKGPMVGMSMVWNQHSDHLGFQVKVANAYQSKDIAIIRSTIGSAEAGRGDTDIEVQSYVAEVSYQFSDGVKTFYRPYFAMRRALIKQDGYTETGVDNPLTFNTLEDKSTTVIMGLKAKYRISDQVMLNGALGVEHDVDSDVDKLQGTSSTITGLTAVDINSSINKTRPVATLGATYHISPNQTLSAQTQYQELAYTSTSAKTAYVNYTVGF